MDKHCATEGYNHSNVQFLDATEEEVADFVQDMLRQLEIMASCVAMPHEQQQKLKDSIALFRAFLDRDCSKGELI
jgi:hypothetical protein